MRLKSPLPKLLLALLFLAPALSARADLLLTFTTTGDGGAGDTIKGYMTGLTNGTNVDPTAIYLTQVPTSFGITASVSSPFHFVVSQYLTSTASVAGASSTSTGVYGFNIGMVGGVETVLSSTDIGFEDASGNGLGFDYLSTYDAANGLGSGYDGAIYNGVNDYGQTGYAGTTYTITVVPEPRDWTILVLAGVMAIAGLRKLRTRYAAV